MDALSKSSAASDGVGFSGDGGGSDAVAVVAALSLGVLDEFTLSSDEIQEQKAAETALKQAEEEGRIAGANASIAASNAIVAGTKQKNMLEAAAAGGMVGGIGGSVVPGVGTALGAVFGAVMGAFIGYNSEA